MFSGIALKAAGGTDDLLGWGTLGCGDLSLLRAE